MTETRQRANADEGVGLTGPSSTAAGPDRLSKQENDVTGDKNLEQLRAASATRAERLLKVTAAVADAITSEQVYRAVVDEVALAVDASTAGLWLVDDDERTVSLVRSFGYSDSTVRQFQRVPLDIDPTLPVIDAILQGAPVWIASQRELLTRYPHLTTAVTAGRAYQVCCLPVIAHGRTLGALGLTLEAAGPSGEEDRRLLLLVARYASQALERLRLLAAERRSRAEADAAVARMTVLSHASRAFVQANLDLPLRLEAVVAELGTIFDSCVGVALMESDGLLHTAAVYHPDPQARELLVSLGARTPLRVGEGVMGAVVSAGESVLVSTLDPEQGIDRVAPMYRAFVARYPAYALMCVPLRVHGQVIGAIITTRTRPGETYGTEDLQMLEELSDRAAAVIESSRLYQENLEARSLAEQLYRFAQVVVTADRLEQVFDAALNAIERAIATDRSAILLFDDEGVMRFRAWRGVSDEYRSSVEGHSPWPQDAVAPEPLLVHDVADDPAMAAHLPLFRSEGISALAFIPLVTRGRLLGKFMVYHAEPHRYTPHEIEMASAIANHLASVTARFDAVAKLEETIHDNELFAGILAHDLRNPLGAIMNAAQLTLMRQEGEGDKSGKPLGRILSSGQRMTRMIEQLLDFTRARAGGGIEVRRCDTNLADLCDQAVGELEIAFPEWKFVREVDGDQNGTWDPDRLLQTISNLVANAGHHGKPDGIITIKLDGRLPHVVAFTIHNEGAIPESLVPSLFDPFRRARQRSHGLGLGLFIVKEVVRAHGGSVDVVSSRDAGTTFTFRLPR